MVLKPFWKKHHTLSQTALIQIFFIFLLLVGAVIGIYTYNQVSDYKDHIRAMHNLSVDSLEKSVKLQFAGYQLYDQSMNERIKDVFIPFNEAYQKSGGKVEDIDLDAVKSRTRENPEMIDLYIINSSDVICVSSNKQDLFLNFRSSAPRFANYLDEIRNKSGFFPDQVSTEIQTGTKRKWAYMPTRDHQYILETGLKEETFGLDRQLIMNTSDICRDIGLANPSIQEVSLWDFMGNQAGSSGTGSGSNGSADPRVKGMFHSGQSRLQDLRDDIPVRDLTLIKGNMSQYGYDYSLVAQVDSDYPQIQENIREIYKEMAGLFLLVAIISGIILFLTINRISRPLHDIIDDVSQVSQGNLDHTIRDTGITELSDLSDAIEKMKESILYGRLEKLRLLASNKNLNAIIDSIPEPILIIDTRHRIIGWNKAMEWLTGYSNEEMMNAGKETYSPLFLGTPGNLLANVVIDPDLHHAHADQVKHQGLALMVEGWVHVSGKTHKKFLSSVAAPVFQEDGSIFAAIETVRDNSILKEVEEALRYSEEKYRILVENSRDIIFTLNLDGEFLFVSASCEKYIGYSLDESIGHHYRAFWNPEDIHPVDAAFEEVILTGTVSKPLIFRGKHADGTWKWYSTILSPVFGSSGNVIQVSGVSRDITSQKMTEDALKLALRKLSVLNSITRHDIRNQLRAILGFLYFDRKELMDPEQIRRNQIEENACLSILDHIEFGYLYQDIGKDEPVWNPVAVIVDKVCTQLDLHDITVIREISGFQLFADPMFEKVLYAYFDNSIRHGKTVTEIRLWVDIHNSSCSLIYEDNGVGIAENEKEVIFNQGYGKNTGIGLFLSREILSLTGLEIIERGIPGKGARFEIHAKKGLFRWSFLE